MMSKPTTSPTTEVSEVRAFEPTSPHHMSMRAGAGQELLEGRGAGIGVDLVGG